MGKIMELFGNIMRVKEDLIDAQKSMVSNIQMLVGIHNVFHDENRRFSVFHLLATVIFGGAFVYVGTFSQLIYLVQVLPDKVESFKAFNCISATSVPFSKYIFMWVAGSRLKTIFEKSREGLASIPSGSSAQKAMLAALTKARFVSWLVVFNQGVCHMVYLMVPFLFSMLGNDRYLPTTPGDAFGLTPKYETPFYETTFVLTTLGTTFSGVNQSGYIVLFVTLLAHDLGHLYSITETFNEIYRTLSQKTIDNHIELSQTVNEKLKFCIRQHQFLLKFHGKIKDLYRIIFGAHFLMMTVVLVTTLQTLNEWDVRNTILAAVTGILPLFIYCFGGELMISACEELSIAIYSCGWERMEAKQAKVVLLMLYQSQRPLLLTAMDIFVMSRETFGKVVQVVYKIYAVFN